MKRKRKPLGLTLTSAEEEFILCERERIELDSRDWNREPFVTQVQLLTMSPFQASWFRLQPEIWVADMNAAVIWNMAHPSNEKRCAEHWLRKALRDLEQETANA